MSFLEKLQAAREILSLGSDLVSLLRDIGRAFKEHREADAVEIAQTRAREQASGRARDLAAKAAGARGPR